MSDPRSPAGIRAKVDRARQHLLALDDGVHAYLDTEPLDLQRQVQPDGVTSAFAVVVRHPPPLVLSVLVGEVAHQLRSAVDHVANGLVLAAGNKPTQRTSFPVLTSAPEQLRVHGGVTAEALDMIEQVQPYRFPEPERHPLHVLNRLWNVDKHRNLHLTAVMLQDSQMFVGAADGTALVGGQFQGGPIREGDLIGAFAFADGEPDPQSTVIASATTFLVLGEPGPWPDDRPVQLVMEDLYRYITNELLPKFEPFL